MFSRIPFAKKAARISARFVGGTALISFVTATYYRPLPLPEEDNGVQQTVASTGHSTSHLQNKRKHPQNNVLQEKQGSKPLGTNTMCCGQHTALAKLPDRTSATFCSKELPYFSRDETPLLLSIAQHLSIGCTTILIRIFMNTYGEYHIQNDENYAHFLRLVLGGEGRKERGQPLITISNHRSLFDDPGVVSCLLPLWVGIQPKYNRWGICSQEYCFSDALPAIVKGYIGAGQVLPIRRGGGIDQSLLQHFASFVARGEWCHIFPEGGVWQWDELGGRGRFAVLEEESKHVDKSKLKWGIGKLIAHAPIRPRVVPFAHAGMETLLPQDKVTRKTYLKEDLFGGEPLKVRIQFGEEIHFDDLIEEYEKTHGKLWVYGDSSYDKFTSSETEKELYKKITMRVERHLEELSRKVVESSKIQRQPIA